MKKYQYKCTLLTDVIITSAAATEGYKESLDYIPGSKFLGIVAGTLYDEEREEKTLDLFHNGIVKFGDASPFLSNETLLKVPFSWYHIKGEKLTDTLYLHHKNLNEKSIQLKQARTGYFSGVQKIFTSINQDFSLKSAHDAIRRKSEEGKMFGYYSLKAGSEWAFIITDSDGKYSDEIKNILEGNHRIGRSRSAEFGLVRIEFLKELETPKEISINNEIIIYAKSNLCFYNENTGQTTAQPTAKQLTGSDDAEIIWKKSQVRSRNYKTWNRYRNNKDADRIIIERGSVFVLKLHSGLFSTFFFNGIGAHKNEGFGEVLINPPFLISETNHLSFNLSKIELTHTLNYPIKKGHNDNEILRCLKNMKLRNNFDYQIDQKVNDFMRDYKSKFYPGVSKSQWGTLRNYGKNLENKEHFKKLIFDTESGFLYKGQSENEWRTKNRRVILRDYLETLDSKSYLPFVVKLSNQMAKN